MSAYTMKGAPFENIELFMFLPADWKTGQEDFQDDNWYWTIKMLKSDGKVSNWIEIMQGLCRAA